MRWPTRARTQCGPAIKISCGSCACCQMPASRTCSKGQFAGSGESNSVCRTEARLSCGVVRDGTPAPVCLDSRSSSLKFGAATEETTTGKGVVTKTGPPALDRNPTGAGPGNNSPSASAPPPPGVLVAAEDSHRRNTASMATPPPWGVMRNRSMPQIGPLVFIAAHKATQSSKRACNLNATAWLGQAPVRLAGSGRNDNKRTPCCAKKRSSCDQTADCVPWTGHLAMTCGEPVGAFKFVWAPGPLLACFCCARSCARRSCT